MDLYQMRKQRRRRRRRQRFVILPIFAILAIDLAFLLVTWVKAQNGAPGESTELSWEPTTIEIRAESLSERQKEATTVYQAKESKRPKFSYSKDWGADDSYLLAKIAMAEAEGETVEGKALVILVVLNRVWSDEFPNTIRDVIYQDNQFSPVASGRFDAVEPDADCWTAVESVMTAQYDYSEGALYFESCKNADNWHSRNLEFLYQVGNHKFYK